MDGQVKPSLGRDAVHSTRRVVLHSVTLVVFLAASAAPAPLYRLWQREWGFSSVMLTLVFAVYALAVLAALLWGGGLSDRLGRRPVIGAAIVGEILAMVLFAAARNAEWLLLARAVQGISTGIAMAATGAAILDAAPQRGPLLNAILPMLGMGFGALGAGLAVRWSPPPVLFLVLAALLLVQGGLTAVSGETVTAQADGSAARRPWWQPRLAVPAAARPALLAATPAALATWALGGFSLSLLPSLLARTVPGSGSLLGGVSVAVLTGGAILAILVARGHAPERVLPAGAAGLALGVAGMLLGVRAGSAPLLLAAAFVAGLGFGAGWFGAVRSVLPMAAPAERAGLMSAFLLECYLAYTLPVIAAGMAVRRIGLLPTADWFGAGVIAVSLAAVAASLGRLLASRRSVSPRASRFDLA